MDELNEALEDFRAKFSFYETKLKRGYRMNMGTIDSNVVEAAWNRYLKLRKQHRGF